MCGKLIKFYPVDPKTESFSLSNGQDVFVETLANTHKCYYNLCHLLSTDVHMRARISVQILLHSEKGRSLARSLDA